MNSLFFKHDRLMELTPMKIVRQWAQTINWNARLLSIRGPKGVGKSTMMCQYIKQHYEYMDRQVLYVSCDNSYFSTHSLLDLAEQFYLSGGKHLFIDEIHKYDNWSREIKEIYDFYPTLKIVISGSSLLSLMEGDVDLSRRCINHDIQGLSFREFLHFYKGIEMPVYPFLEKLVDMGKYKNLQLTLTDDFDVIVACHARPLSLDVGEPVEKLRDADGIILPGGVDVNPALYHEKNTASRFINDELDELEMKTIAYALKHHIPMAFHPYATRTSDNQRMY